MRPRISIRGHVRRSVGPSVGPSHFTFSAFMGILAIPLLPKCATDLKYGPCPPARDWGSCVSGLIIATRPDTRLPQSRADGQGQYLRSVEDLSGSSEAQNLTNAEKVKCDGKMDGPAKRGVESSARH